jgi:hypothetical protein
MSHILAGEDYRGVGGRRVLRAKRSSEYIVQREKMINHRDTENTE